MRLVLLFAFVVQALWAAEVFPPPKSLPPHEGLPDLFVDGNGRRIESAEAWLANREQLKAMLAYYQYGRMPPKPPSFQIADRQESVSQEGNARRESFPLVLRRNGHSVGVRVGVVRPNRPGRFPVIVKNDVFIFDLNEIANARRREQYADEGRDKVDELVFREAVGRGYAVVKFHREDVAVDARDNRSSGVFPLYPEPEFDWGTIAAWAWFYQPLIDHLVAQDWVDPERIAATGHSRGGKTALCASIYDERIAVSAPSASGSGGTGSWRVFTPNGRHQDVEDMTTSQPHWFTPRLREFIGVDDRLPVGSHTAKALIAPRGLLNTLGADDRLSNPAGTRKTFDEAQAVFELLGVRENQVTHWRPGGHGQLEVDWLALFDFCDRVFFGKESGRRFNNWPER